MGRQQLRQTSGHRDIPDNSSNGTDDGDIQASNAENGGYDSPTPDSDDGGESSGTISHVSLLFTFLPRCFHASDHPRMDRSTNSNQQPDMEVHQITYLRDNGPWDLVKAKSIRCLVGVIVELDKDTPGGIRR